MPTLHRAWMAAQGTGDKSGRWTQWYREAIPLAEHEFRDTVAVLVTVRCWPRMLRDTAGGERRVRSAHSRGSGVGAAEHGDLVPQDEELDVFCGGRAAHQQEQPERVLEDQV